MQDFNLLSTEEIAIKFNAADSREWRILWYNLQKRVDAELYMVALLQHQNKKLKQFLIGMVTSSDIAAVIDAVVQALSDDSDEVRKLAANRLGTLKVEKAVEQLILLTRDPNSSVRNCAINALGNIRDRRSTFALGECLKNGDDSNRIDAIYALHKIRDPASVDILLDALDDRLSSVRYRAVKTLGLLGDKKAVAPLLDMLYDGEDDVCDAAADSLVQLCGTEDIPYLTEVLTETEDEDVRGYLEYCLEKIQNPPLEIPREQWLYRAWFTDPTINASSDICEFYENGTGEFKYFNMGVASDEIAFQFRLEEDKIHFLLENETEWIETQFEIGKTMYDHPEEGDMPCLKLVLHPNPLNKNHKKSRTYYHIWE
jgi:hypothetical protein